LPEEARALLDSIEYKLMKEGVNGYTE